MQAGSLPRTVTRESLEAELLRQGLHPWTITAERLVEFASPEPYGLSRWLTPDDRDGRDIRWKWLCLMKRCYRNVNCNAIERDAGELLRGVAIGLNLRQRLGPLSVSNGERLGQRIAYESWRFEQWTRTRHAPAMMRLTAEIEGGILFPDPRACAVAIVDVLDVQALGTVDADEDLRAAQLGEVWHRRQRTFKDARKRLEAEARGGTVHDESQRVAIDSETLSGFYETLGQAMELSRFDANGRLRASPDRWKTAFDKLDGYASQREGRRRRRGALKRMELEPEGLDAAVDASRHTATLLDALASKDSAEWLRDKLASMHSSASRTERALIDALLADPDASPNAIAERAGVTERAVRKARASIRAKLDPKNPD